MRQVTRESTEAFLSQQAGRFGNTHTDGRTLFLHGNPIAGWRNGRVEISDAGWMTNTTRERLSGLVYAISRAGGTWTIKGGPDEDWKTWDGDWHQVTTGGGLK